MNIIIAKIREINSYISKYFLKISIVLFVVFLLSAVASYFFVMALPQEEMMGIIEKLNEIYNSDNMMQKEGFALFWAIFVNNLRASGVSVVSAIIPFLFFPLWSVVSNGITTGMAFGVASYLGEENMFLLFLKYVLPHGIFEIPVFILANAMGLYYCWLFIKKIFGKAKEERIRYHFEKFSEILFLYFIPFLLLAAFIEGVLEIWIFGT